MRLPPSLSHSFRPGLKAFSAGTNPKVTPVNSETASVKPSTLRSTPISSRRGTFAGMKVTSRSMLQNAKSNPNPPPIKANSMFSVINCRTRRIPLAPSALRMAISFSLAFARTSSKLTTLVHDIRSTKLTAPKSTSKAGRISPTMSSCRGTTLILQPESFG